MPSCVVFVIESQMWHIDQWHLTDNNDYCGLFRKFDLALSAANHALNLGGMSIIMFLSRDKYVILQIRFTYRL